MTENKMLKIAVHCLGVQAEQEVCEECPAYRESGIVCKEIARTAISALKEIQQYRKIGTVEECREAVEKQKKKAPDYEGDGYADGHMVYDTWVCPGCEAKYEVDYDDFSYCPECGQAINWEESEE